MNLKLTRKQRRGDGIFSDLCDEDATLVAQTLEHSYLINDVYSAKIPAGMYQCKRGFHKLHGMTEPFETFEVTNVPGCFGILFHWGNYNSDSDGCVLLGNHLAKAEDGSQMITDSRKAFVKFMALQESVNEFTLTVR